MTTDTDTERVQRFLEELGELSRRTGVSIFGCGCCGSPRLELDEDPESDYVVDYDSGARRAPAPLHLRTAALAPEGRGSPHAQGLRAGTRRRPVGAPRSALSRTG